MSPSGQASRGKIAGVALLGVAAIALVIGIVTVSSGTESASNAQPSPSGSATGTAPSNGSSAGREAPGGAHPSRAPGSPSHTRPGSSSKGIPPTEPPGQTTTVVPPPASPIGPGQQHVGGAQQAANTSADVRVYNNSMIRDLAAHAAAEFRAAGYHVVHVGNYPYGTIPTTTMYYRPGTNEQATAESLAREFGATAKPRFSGIQNADPGVIVIVTKDFHGPVDP